MPDCSADFRGKLRHGECNVTPQLIDLAGPARKLTLTTAGRAFYEEVADSIERLERAGQAVLGEKNALSGVVRIAAAVDFFDLFPMTWIREFMTANPKIQFDFVMGDTAIDLIAQGIDIAFRAGVLPDSSYVTRKISDAFAVLVASPELLKSVSPKARAPVGRKQANR